MKHILAAYKAPLLVSAACMAILCGWGVFEFRQADAYRTEMLRRHSGGVFNSLEGIINSLNEHAPYNIEHLRIILNGVLRTTGLSFACITHNGNITVKAGSVPHSFSTPGPSGERKERNIFLTWRPVSLGRAGGTRSPSHPDDTSTVQTLVLGLSADWWAGEHENRMLNLRFKLGGGALVILAICAVWVLTVHSKNLSSELAMERIKRGHFEELGLAAAGLAHEAKNPLGIIRGSAQRLREHQSSGTEQKQTADHIIDAVDRTSARLGEFMEYAKFREPSVTDVNAYTVAQKVIDVLNPDFEEKDVAVRLEADPLSIQADEEMFRQALVNLLLNSLHASEAGDSVTVRLHRGRHNITLTVEDEAEGIEAGLLPDVCKPYVSGTPEGHGMGLAVVKRIADQHGWDLEIVSNKQTGTSVSVSGIQGTVL